MHLSTPFISIVFGKEKCIIKNRWKRVYFKTLLHLSFYSCLKIYLAFSLLLTKKAALIHAATGVINAIPIPAQRIIMISPAKTLELTTSPKEYVISLNQISNPIYAPKKAKNNVLVFDPKISLPIFIPDLNNSLRLIFG